MDDVQWINDLEVVLTSVASAAAVAALFFYWRRLRKGMQLGRDEQLREFISEATRQIRTDSNGGQSLNDVNKRVNDLHGKVDAHIDLQVQAEHKRDMQFQELKYELALIRRVAGQGEGE